MGDYDTLQPSAQRLSELPVEGSLGFVHGFGALWIEIGRGIPFVRKSTNVACRIVERKGRAEVGLSSKRNTGIILYLEQQISVSRKRQGNQILERRLKNTVRNICEFVNAECLA